MNKKKRQRERENTKKTNNYTIHSFFMLIKPINAYIIEKKKPSSVHHWMTKGLNVLSTRIYG